jgi:hypothetical protein
LPSTPVHFAAIDKRAPNLHKEVVSDRASSWPRFPWWLALASLAVYACTLCPSVFGGDSSELAAGGTTWGVLHSPGYPLYTLLANVANLVPIGEPAARVNFVSALCSALASGFLATVAWWWTGSRPASVLAWAAWSFAPLVWRYSVVAEVFALNNLVWCAQLALSWRFAIARSRRALFAGAFVAGLGVAHHPTIAFGSVPLVAWSIALLVRERREETRDDRAQARDDRAQARENRPHVARDLLIALACFVAGLTPYLYLPWAAVRVPEVSWGDPTTLDGVLYMVLRKEVGTLSLVHRGSTGASAWDGLVGFALEWWREFLAVGAALTIVGWVHAFRRGGPLRAHAIVLAIATIAYVAVFAVMGELSLAAPLLREIVARFWQWPYAVFALYAALGASTLEAWGRARAANAFVPRAVFVYAPLALFFVRVPFAWRAESCAGERRFAIAARAVLESLPSDALLMSAGDMWTNLFRYEQLVGGVRPDVIVLDRAMLTRPWYARTVHARHPSVDLPDGVLRAQAQPGAYAYAQFLALNAKHFRIFHTEGQNDEQIGASWRAQFEEHPFGITNEIVRVDTETPAAAREELASSFAWLADVDRRVGPRGDHDGVWVRELYASLDRASGRTVRGVLAFGASLETELAASAKSELARIRAAYAGEPPQWLLLLELEVYTTAAELKGADRTAFERAYTEFLQRADPADPNVAKVKHLRRRALRSDAGDERAGDRTDK